MMYLLVMSSDDVIKALKSAGWVLARTKGSHHQMSKDGRVVTVPHPKKDLGIGLLKAIEKSSGVKLL